MLFWIVVAAMALLVAGLLARPLLDGGGTAAAPAPTDQAVYRDQLAEVDRDVARGVLNPEDAERARAEIARRLIAADRAGAPPMDDAPTRLSGLGAALAALLALALGLGLYLAIGRPGLGDLPRAERLAQAQALRASRPSQAEAEAEAAASLPPPPADLPADYLDMVADLREVVPTRPDDLPGWELLALHEARLGNYAAAARAQERVVALKGEDATAADWVALADRMVAAAGGFVSPETEAVLAEVMARDDDDFALLYYLGLLEAQTGRPDRAFPLWREVVEEAPDGLHRRLALAQIEQAAWLAGVDYTAPAEGGAAIDPAAAPGPTPREIANAAAMDPAMRGEMIGGMVEGLRARLDAQGGTAEEWGRLIVSLVVLGDAQGARAALDRARAAFAGDGGALAVLTEAAAQAGLEPPP